MDYLEKLFVIVVVDKETTGTYNLIAVTAFWISMSIYNHTAIFKNKRRPILSFLWDFEVYSKN